MEYGGERRAAAQRGPLRGRLPPSQTLRTALAPPDATHCSTRCLQRRRGEGAGRGGARVPRQWRECGDAMRSFVRAATLAALLALATAAARRSDQDFEFDDDTDAAAAPGGGAHSRRPSRYVYDPHNSLCRSLVCKKREVCVLRDAFTALCATKKDILRRGDVIVAASTSGGAWEGERDSGQSGRDDNDDDVFYDTSVHDTDVDPDLDADDAKRCVGCGGRARAQFLCGSDNRTYSSLCRLDLHNCVRRGARPVRLACRGFCPCAPARRARLAPPRARPAPCRACPGAAPDCAHAPTTMTGGGGYVPACDARGFYRPRQCHAALAVCWCVDPHGQELPGSRTKGAPACPGEKSMADVEGGEEGDPSEAGEEGEAGEAGEAGAQGAPDDDEDGAGSGDAELHF
ncbi:proteoglycan Cow [Spodoptera litura]|uniref:Proteoglycan Cow n=1 Tax=Spodoptera litura TaxID=69820 RepID=A0A9J7EUS3_SPOLT|nr:proteoglycan Cow [Spodoptera litura]